MQLVFADPPKDVKPVERACACDACGFVGKRGFVEYRENDLDRINCDMCYVALHLHAETYKPDMGYGLTWAPEISQASLGIMMRVMAFSKVSSTKRAERVGNHAAEIMSGLRRRRARLQKILGADIGEDVFSLWPELPERSRLDLLKGMRLFKSAFVMADVEDWRSEGCTFAGFGDDVIEKEKWFLDVVDPQLATALAAEFA